MNEAQNNLKLNGMLLKWFCCTGAVIQSNSKALNSIIKIAKINYEE